MSNNEEIKITGKKLIRNISKFSVVSIFAAVLSFTVIPIITRVFSPEEFGKINMFFTIGNMMMAFVLMGIDSAYIRYFHEPPKGTNKKQIFVFSIIVGLVVNIVIGILVFIINPDYISRLIFGENNVYALFVLFIYVMTLIVFRQLNITYRMEENAKQYNIQNILQILINRVLFVSVALFAATYFYAILAITIGMVLLSVFYIWKQRNLFYGVNHMMQPNAMRELLLFSIPLMPTTIIVWLNNSTAKLMLGQLGNHSEIGIIAIAISLANLFAIIPNGFGVYWGSFMYKNYKTQREIIKSVHNYVTIGSIVIVIGIIIMQDILYGILGSEYRSSQPYFMLIMLNPIQAFLSETTSYGISIAKKTKYNMLVMLLGYSVNLFICYLTIPILGGLGAAFAIALSSLTILILKTIIGQHYYNSIESNNKTLLGFLIIIILCIGNLYYYNSMAVRTLVSIAMILLTYIIYRKELNYLLRSVLNKFVLEKSK